MTTTPADMPSGLTIFAIGFCLMGTFLLLLWAVNYLKGWRPSHMSSEANKPTATIAPANRSVDQSAPTSLKVRTSTALVASLEATPEAPTPDMDAEQTSLDGWEMPRVSRYLSDDEFLTMLAAQKLRDGKWRLSANKIVAMVGGDRTHVLALIRQVREPAPEFKPLTPEQQQVRQQLQLGER
jgi:hypothetical protein